MHKFLTVHKDSSIIVAPRTNEAIFTIKHYAGDVVYTGDTFLEKNRDRSARLLWPLVLVSYTPTNVNKLSHPDVFCRISLFPLPSSLFPIFPPVQSTLACTRAHICCCSLGAMVIEAFQESSLPLLSSIFLSEITTTGRLAADTGGAAAKKRTPAPRARRDQQKVLSMHMQGRAPKALAIGHRVVVVV